MTLYNSFGNTAVYLPVVQNATFHLFYVPLSLSYLMLLFYSIGFSIADKAIITYFIKHFLNVHVQDISCCLIKIFSEAG